jgi:hypothetical protein
MRSDAVQTISALFIAAIMRISRSENRRQLLAVMENMATCSDLRSPDKSLAELARESAVPGWDTLGR